MRGNKGKGFLFGGCRGGREDYAASINLTSALHNVQNKASSSPDCCCKRSSSLRQSSLKRQAQKKPPSLEQHRESCLSDCLPYFNPILLGSSIEDALPG